MRLALRRLVITNYQTSQRPPQTPVARLYTQQTTIQSYKQDCKWCPLWRGKDVTRAIPFYGTRLLWFQERSYQKAPPSANAEGKYVAIRDTKPHPQCTRNQQSMDRHSLTAVRKARLSVYKFSRKSQSTQYIFVEIPVPNLTRMGHILRTPAEFHLWKKGGGGCQ